MTIQAQIAQPVVATDLLAVGVDIAKGMHVSQLKTGTRLVGKPFRIEVSRKGFEAFVQYVEENRKRLGSSKVVIGFEPTGHYWMTFAKFVEQRAYDWVFINPAHTKKLREVEDNSPDKSDPKCAAVIADLVARGSGLKRAPCRGVYLDLRELSRLRQRRVTEAGRCRNRIRRVLDVVFPELLGIAPGLGSKATRAALQAAVTAGDFVELGSRRLGNILRKASRNRVDPSKAKEIVAVAQASVGIEDAAEARRLEIEELLARWEQLDGMLQRLESRLDELLTQVPYAQDLLAIHGLSIVSVAGLLGEAGDLNEYQRGAGAVKMAGLNLCSLKSGKTLGQPYISKHGNGALRHFVHLAVLSLVRPRGVLRAKYDQLRERGVARPKAMVAMSRKLLRVLFAMVRDKKPFQAELVQPAIAQAA
jgi:transposase